MNKPIEEYNNFGELTKLYWSIQSAATALNINSTKMAEIIKTGTKFKGKLYKYYYAENFGSKVEIYPIQQYNKDSGIVVNQFKTISEAAISLPYNRNAIGRCIQTGEQDKFGYCWRKNINGKR